MKRALAVVALLGLAPSAHAANPPAKAKNVRYTLLTRYQIDHLNGNKDKLISATTEALQRKNSDGKKRGFHGAPALGVAKAELTPLAEVPEPLAPLLSRGIFGEASKAVV